MITSPTWSGKRYAVLGLARSGAATVDALLASGASVVAWDEDEAARERLGSRHGGNVKLVDPLDLDLAGFDAIVLSPGIPLNTHPIAAAARTAGVPLIGDIELFAQARASLPSHKVVGITGTNGKSTTTALAHHIVEASGRPSAMGGNIGLPILAQEPLEPNENGVGVYVLELSSYQIDLTQSLDCDVAVLLNISPDHLDRYDDMDAYKASKNRIFEMQGPGSIAIRYPRGHPELQQCPAIMGAHNAQNIAAASGIADALKINAEFTLKAFGTFEGLPHRMERVAERRGVLFVNDSKATNPASAAPALAAYDAVHWIVGGRVKGDDLDACEPSFAHVRAAYAIGEAAPRFTEILKGHMPVANCGTLSAAVRAAASAAASGEVVLLSPACASFDQFKDFEARGDAFRAAVEALG